MLFYAAAAGVGRRNVASIIFYSPIISSSTTTTTAPLFRQQQKRTIYSKHAVPDYAKHGPEPWPYKERGFRAHHKFLDFGVSKRLGENSKLIVVEGNVGSGKSKFAQELADRLGFYHIPDPNLDDLFIDSYGDDRRLHYHLYPETCRMFDTRMFYEQPKHRNVAQFQRNRLFVRVEAYMNALAHILNTGQGVVLERCHHTDAVFVEAMYKKGYLSDAFRYYYYKELCKLVFNEIKLEAHLVIYLDCPVTKCMENIKKHHKPWEWKNEVMDYSYLEHMEKGLKNWLKHYSRHAEIISYDWSHGGDADSVVEDILKLDLDTYDKFKNEKFETWHLMPHEYGFTEYRRLVTSAKYRILSLFHATVPQVEELVVSLDDMKQRKAIHEMLFGKYATGFREDRGDSVTDIATSNIFARDIVTNRPWSEYIFKDQEHIRGHDLHMHEPGPPHTPSFPEELFQPRSPYKSDGGCMAHAELFMDEHGRLDHGHH